MAPFLPRTSLVVERESVERKNLRHMLLELNLQVNVRKKKLYVSSDVRLTERPKLKNKKPPAQVARDRSRRKAFWKRTKVARKLSTENWAAHYARLQETKSVASPRVPVVSHPENSGACLESTHFVSETT